MRVLLTGGAGYIGSHTAKALAQAGMQPIVFDNFSTGHRWAVKWGPVCRGDLSDSKAIRRAVKQHSIQSVIHFAAHAYVGESIHQPRKYFQNNATNTLNLFDALLDTGVEQIVFSSSCAVYGLPQQIPISEDHPKVPVNPYGESKLFVERVLEWYGRAYGLRWASLRYFNAAGADPEGEIGELHIPETHLIPLVIQCAMAQREEIEIYGLDYDTPDGTCIRDYIHVSDLAEAHVKALQCLISKRENFTVNLGTGRGISVREIIARVERVAGAPIRIATAMRRPGDPPCLIGDPSRAEKILGWKPKRSSLGNIIATAWNWHCQTKSSRSALTLFQPTARPNS